jgi:hypothetical protein
MNQIDSAAFDKLHSAFLRHELRPNAARAAFSGQSKACLDHWSLGFGYCLFFAIWCLEFFQFKDLSRLTDPIQLIGHIYGA